MYPIPANTCQLSPQVGDCRSCDDAALIYAASAIRGMPVDLSESRIADGTSGAPPIAEAGWRSCALMSQSGGGGAAPTFTTVEASDIGREVTPAQAPTTPPAPV